MVNRGDIWWADLPSGRRPVLVVTRQDAIPVLRAVVAVLVTRTMRGVPSELALDQDDGMPEPCVANFDNLITVPKADLVTRITTLGPESLVDVCDTIDIALGC